MPKRLAPTAILITAATYAGFAIWLSLSPSSLLTAFGIQTSTPAMLTEIRAFYGGIEMAIAIAMLILWRQDNQAAALLIGGLPLAGSAIGRLLGMSIDGFSTLHVSFAAIETLGAIICLACYTAMRMTNTPKVDPSDSLS